MNDSSNGESEDDSRSGMDWLISKYLEKHDLEEKPFIKLLCASQSHEVGHVVIIAFTVRKSSV